jgi:hypothetical protein
MVPIPPIDRRPRLFQNMTFESFHISYIFLSRFVNHQSTNPTPRVSSRSNGLDSTHSSLLHEGLFFLLANLLELHFPDLLIFYHLSPPTMDGFHGLQEFTSPQTPFAHLAQFPPRDLSCSQTSSTLLVEFCTNSSATFLGLKTSKVFSSFASFNVLSLSLLTT